MRNDKKGMELAISFIVVIIISIVIFGSGLYLVSKFFKATSSFQDQIDAETKNEIERRLIETGEKATLPINKKMFEPGETKAFWLGLLNTRQDVDSGCFVGGGDNPMPCKRYGVVVRYAKAIDSMTQKDLSTLPEYVANPAAMPDPAYMNTHWIFATQPPVDLRVNEQKIVPIQVKVDPLMGPNAGTRKKTIFVFNVCVYANYDDAYAAPDDCGERTDSYSFLEQLYGKKVLKMYIETR